VITGAERNQTVEAAALIADAEADRLDALAADMRRQIGISPRRGLKWRLDEFLAGARAARRIATSIRQQKVSEDGELQYVPQWPHSFGSALSQWLRRRVVSRGRS
jgi:hypothetical protein